MYLRKQCSLLYNMYLYGYIDKDNILSDKNDNFLNEVKYWKKTN